MYRMLYSQKMSYWIYKKTENKDLALICNKKVAKSATTKKKSKGVFHSIGDTIQTRQ